MSPEQPETYDRRLLLAGPRRNSQLALWEVRQYGLDSFGDPDYVSIYGLRPEAWFAAGVRLIGRTAVECTRDELASAIAEEIAGFTVARGWAGPFVIDPFAGSGNTLYWILRRLPGATGLGFEQDEVVFSNTARSFAALDVPIEILHADYATGLEPLAVADDRPIVAFLAPPWGRALSADTGLDLRRTTPRVIDVVDRLLARFPRNPILLAVQIIARLEPAALAELRGRTAWSRVRMFGMDPTGDDPGVLLMADDETRPVDPPLIS